MFFRHASFTLFRSGSLAAEDDQIQVPALPVVCFWGMYTGQHGTRTWMLCKWSSFSRVWFSEYLLNLPGLGTELLTCYIGILLRDMVRKSDENAWVQQQDLRKTTTMFPKGQADIIAFEDAGFFKGFKKEMNTLFGQFPCCTWWLIIWANSW